MHPVLGVGWKCVSVTEGREGQSRSREAWTMVGSSPGCWGLVSGLVSEWSLVEVMTANEAGKGGQQALGARPTECGCSPEDPQEPLKGLSGEEWTGGVCV